MNEKKAVFLVRLGPSYAEDSKLTVNGGGSLTLMTADGQISAELARTSLTASALSSPAAFCKSKQLGMDPVRS